MEAFLRYILISTFCLSFCYLGYLIFLRNELRFKHLRYFLLASMLMVILIPLSNLKINFNLPINQSENIEYALQPEEITPKTNEIVEKSLSPITYKQSLSLYQILIRIYFLGLSVFTLRLLIHFITILQLYIISNKKRQDKNTLLIHSTIKSPYSFFNWIFLPAGLSNKNDHFDILTHERIHASQYHSIDIILIELLSAVMWFNPLVWMMKKSIKLVHEYLADEGVLSTGIDKFEYQALLINQVAEERFICLSSSLNYSLIKKRIIMMNKNQINKNSRLRILALIPIAIILFVGIACINGQEVNKNSKVYTIIVDAGHGGKDPGAQVNDKIAEKDLTLSIVKILKEKASSNKNLNLIFTRENDEFLELNKRTTFDADLLISIHMNYSSNSEISGIECFVARDSEYKDKSEKIGKLLISELSQLSGIKTQNSLKETNFIILKDSKCPALLLDIGYLSNSNDLSFIIDTHNQGLICDKIINAISQLN